jgi:hypothetical protein
MSKISLWSRILVIVGLVAMLIGAVDPLEGSIVIVAGTGMVALGALLGKSRYRNLLIWSFALTLVGIAAMWGLSAVGGIGGSSGHSIYWGLLILPYPIGWIIGIIGAILRLRETRKRVVLQNVQ